MKYDKNYPLRGFTFHCIGAGLYRVSYESDYDFRVGRYWSAVISDMTLIDATKNAVDVKRRDVDALRRAVKRAGLVTYK